MVSSTSRRSAKNKMSRRLQRRKKNISKDDKKVSRLLKVSQDIAVQMLAACNTDPLEIAIFESYLFDFVQALPSNQDDFDSPNQYWVGTLYVIWNSDSEEGVSKLSISGPWSTNRAGTISSTNHSVLYKIAPNLMSIAALLAKDYVLQLEVSGFDHNNLNDGSDINNAKPPSIESVFQAFSKASFWKTKLRRLSVSHSHMNATGDDFELEGAYPEGLEEVHVYPCNRGGIESSTIYKVASRSTRLRILATGGSGGTEMVMTPSALHHVCGILSRVNTFDASYKQLSLSHLPDNDFCKVMEALMTGHSHPLPTRSLPSPNGHRTGWGFGHAQICKRQYLLEFYFQVNQYRVIFRDRALPKALAPLIFDHCQQKARVCDVSCSELKATQRRALLFYLLRERVDWIIAGSSVPGK